MTIVCAWVRASKRGAEELIVCSDSRLSGGGTLDCSPKVFQLPRTDAVIAFSGATYLAYPLLLQMTQAINSHGPMRDGVLDYARLKSFLLRLLNELFGRFDTYLDAFKKPEHNFLLCGYSWFHKEFMIDRFEYDHYANRFQAHPVVKGIGNFGKIAFIGDVRKQANHQLITLLRRRYGDASVLPSSTLVRRYDMEPFEIIRDMLRSARPEGSIGGAPQLISLCQHMISKPLGIFWPDKKSNDVFVNGRPVFDFENIDSWIIDPDSLKKSHKYLPRKDPTFEE